jgi:hypothetical protein
MGTSCCLSLSNPLLDTEDDLGEALIIDTVVINPMPSSEKAEYIFAHEAPEVNSLSDLSLLSSSP